MINKTLSAGKLALMADLYADYDCGTMKLILVIDRLEPFCEKYCLDRIDVIDVLNTVISARIEDGIE